MITCVPEIKIEKHTSKNEFLVLACDGIWDCLTSAESVNIVRDFLNGPQGKGNFSVCLEQMFDKIVASDVASSGNINFKLIWLQVVLAVTT